MIDDITGTAIDTPSITALKARRAKRIQGLFVKGPIRIEWAKACHDCHRDGLLLAMALRMETDRTGRPWVVVGRRIEELLDITPDRRRNAIDALEEAGMIEVKRTAHSAPRVRLIWPM